MCTHPTGAVSAVCVMRQQKPQPQGAYNKQTHFPLANLMCRMWKEHTTRIACMILLALILTKWKGRTCPRAEDAMQTLACSCGCGHLPRGRPPCVYVLPAGCTGRACLLCALLALLKLLEAGCLQDPNALMVTPDRHAYPQWHASRLCFGVLHVRRLPHRPRAPCGVCRCPSRQC